MTDEKLIECSAASVGVYIRIMCLMHKQEQYGKILLKQKYKQTTKQTTEQTDKQILFFARQLDISLPYSVDVIYSALTELIREKVLLLDGDFLVQKRMEKDGILSEIRASAGKRGGKTTHNFAKAKLKANTQANTQAKGQANTENEIEYENEIENEYVNASEKKEVEFEIFEKWTDELIESDHVFEQMLMKEYLTLSPQELVGLVKGHLELLARYPKMQPNTIQKFRKSAINYIKENKNKLKNGKQTDTKRTYTAADFD